MLGDCPVLFSHPLDREAYFRSVNEAPASRASHLLEQMSLAVVVRGSTAVDVTLASDVSQVRESMRRTLV